MTNRIEHVLFGYLQIGSVFRTDIDATPCPLRTHPHVHPAFTGDAAWRRPNAVYAAASKLVIDWRSVGRPGYGTFSYDESLVLTRPAAHTHTEWRLPPCFREVSLSYHRAGGRYGWTADGESFRSAHRGQEFVFEATPGVLAWVEGLVSSHRGAGVRETAQPPAARPLE